MLKHAHRVAGTGGGAGAGAGAQAGSAASKRAKGAAPVKWSKAEVRILCTVPRVLPGAHLTCWLVSPQVLTLKKLFDTMDVDLSGSVDITGVPVLLLFRHPHLHAMLTPAVYLPTSEFSRNLHDRLVSHMRGMFDILDRNHDGRRCCVLFCVFAMA